MYKNNAEMSRIDRMGIIGYYINIVQCQSTNNAKFTNWQIAISLNNVRIENTILIIILIVSKESKRRKIDTCLLVAPIYFVDRLKKRMPLIFFGHVLSIKYSQE